MRGNKKLYKYVCKGDITNAIMITLVMLINATVIYSANTDNDSFYENIMRQDEVAMQILQKYVENISPKDLIDNSIKGMLQILDPHTNYFEPTQYKQMRIDTKGKFGGLGFLISIREKVLTVLSPYKDSPASRAGIQSGDQIIKIEGISTAGMSMDNIIKLIRGEPGTNITITIRRKGEENDRDYSVVREIIHIKAVPFAGVFQNNIGYIQLAHFSEEAGADVEKAIKKLTTEKITGLILDLRGNPGGLFDQAIEVAEKFLPRKSLIVSTRGRMRGQNRENYSGARPICPIDMPLVVLVDYSSASASEIVAGAIQDYDRGVIVGDTTFGKGSVQSILPLDKSHHMKMTTAFYYTPSGRCLNRPENAPRHINDKEQSSEKNVASNDVDLSMEEQCTIDTVIYLTKNGRVVHGSGGIIPDIIVEQKSLQMTLRMLFGKDVFFRFANIEYPRLKKRQVKINTFFSVDDSIMKSFYRFLDSIQFHYQSLAQMQFLQFMLSAGLKDTVDSKGKQIELFPEIPSWNKNEKQLMQEYATKMDSLLRNESRRALMESEQEIKKHLREAFLTREFGQDEELLYREHLLDDPQFETALSLIADNGRYTALLQPPFNATTTVDVAPVKKLTTKTN